MFALRFQPGIVAVGATLVRTPGRVAPQELSGPVVVLAVAASLSPSGTASQAVIRWLTRQPPLQTRSPHWGALVRRHLALYPTCAACGGRLFRQVHHVVPFHDRPDLELDPGNLITLCMRPLRSCHLKVGHWGNWRSSNPNVRLDAARNLRMRRNQHRPKRSQ